MVGTTVNGVFGYCQTMNICRIILNSAKEPQSIVINCHNNWNLYFKKGSITYISFCSSSQREEEELEKCSVLLSNFYLSKIRLFLRGMAWWPSIQDINMWLQHVNCMIHVATSKSYATCLISSVGEIFPRWNCDLETHLTNWNKNVSMKCCKGDKLQYT